MGFLIGGLLYIGMTALFFHHNLPILTTDLIGPPEDNMQDLWNVWYSQQLSSLRVSDWFFTKRLFYPEGTSLLYHSFAYTDLAVIRIIRMLLGLSLTIPILVTLHNIMLLASFFFAAMAMYFTAYYFTRSFPAAWLGGFIFAFSPFHFAHSLHHMHVATIQFIPLFVLCAIRFEETKKSSYGLAAVLFCVLSALSSWYFLAYNLLFLFFHYLYRSFQTKRLFVGSLLLQHAAVAGIALVLLSPLISAMIKAGSHNPSVYEPGHDIFVADLAGLFVPHPYHLMAGSFTAFHERFTGNPWEMSVYLGILNVGLLIGAILLPRHRGNPLFRWCIWGMVFFTAIAGGRHLHVLGRTLMPLILPTGVFEHLPLLGILRTPSRAIVYTYFFLGLAVAWIVACILRQSRLEAPVQGRLQWGQALIVGALSVGIVVDYLSINRESTPVICPPAYAVLANSDTSAGVLNLPMIYGGGNRFMMYQLCVNRPIVYASISRKINQTLSDRLDDLDASEKKAALKEAGVEHVVVHLALLNSVRSFDLAEYTRNYRLVFQDQTELVFEVD